MMKLGETLTQHRNLFLVLLLAATLLVGRLVGQEDAAPTVNIPVTEAAAQTSSALENYRQQRDADTKSDIAALEALCAQDSLDTQTREDAAAHLQHIIDCRQAQSALEGALLNSSLYPCVAVVSNGNVTIVTEKTTITEKDTALVMSLADVHAGTKPENVRIITAN